MPNSIRGEMRKAAKPGAKKGGRPSASLVRRGAGSAR
jgi:hypothetical protein